MDPLSLYKTHAILNNKCKKVYFPGVKLHPITSICEFLVPFSAGGDVSISTNAQANQHKGILIHKKIEALLGEVSFPHTDNFTNANELQLGVSLKQFLNNRKIWGIECPIYAVEAKLLGVADLICTPPCKFDFQTLDIVEWKYINESFDVSNNKYLILKNSRLCLQLNLLAFLLEKFYYKTVSTLIVGYVFTSGAIKFETLPRLNYTEHDIEKLVVSIENDNFLHNKKTNKTY